MSGMKLNAGRRVWRIHEHHSERKAAAFSRGFSRFKRHHFEEGVPLDCDVDVDFEPGYPPELVTIFERAARESPLISMDPRIMDGQPCVAGTRIPVHSVLRAIEHYGSLEAAVKCYPHLTIPQVKDALYFAQFVLEPTSGIDETETAS